MLSKRNIPKGEKELERYRDIVQNLIDLCDLSEISVWEPTVKSIGEFPTELRLHLCSRISEKLTRCSMETGTTCNIEIKKYMISSMTAVCSYLKRLIDSPTRGDRFLFDQYMINTCTINSIM